MTLPVYRLRRLLAATALLLTVVVAGMYFYARWRATDILKAIPGKMGIEIKQTAHGFQFSKSDGQRTLFTVQASDVKEFRLNGNAQLRNVSILLYGRDSTRFDQIYGDDFAYNQKTGDVTAQGDVQIDLLANPAGLASPDQAAPKELKNPIHLKTRDLNFNKNSGNAWTNASVEFRTAQASGSAVGVKYAGKRNALTLSSQIRIVLSGTDAAVVEAEHGVITSDPREITLERPHITRPGGTLQADRATFYLGPQNHVERIVATGNISTDTTTAGAEKSAPPEMKIRADQAEFLLKDGEDLLHTATLTGNVRFEQSGAQPMQGNAGRVILDFAGRNQLQMLHALDGAHITQHAESIPTDKKQGSAPQDFDLTAPVIDFKLANGRILQHATTSGAAQIVIVQQPDAGAAVPSAPQRTVVTAARFEADFAASEKHARLAAIHGAPDVRIVNATPGEPDRVSTSDSLDAIFLAPGGIDTITQKGKVAYSDGQDASKRMQAWSDAARYTPADQMLVLTGNPRVASGGMATTANSIRINRGTGAALAEGDVKSTYSELKEQPNGALLASSSPIHVTARRMTANNTSAAALYSGNARLWQDANVIEAPTIQFDRDRRSVTAQGTAAHPVQTILVQMEKAQADKTAKAPLSSSPIAIRALKFTYADSERRAHYDGGVVAKGADFTASSARADAFLVPRSQSSTNQPLPGPGQLDRMVAEGAAHIEQKSRRADGEKLVYSTADDKFVLTGGPPSIFDAEQGKITGVSLTFFRRDDRVLVEGQAGTPVVTTTRVAR